MRLRQLRSRISLGLAAVCLFFAGCGSKNNTNVVAVQVFPAGITLLVNQTQTFSASVTGATDTSVTWSLSSVPASSSATPPPTPTPCDDKPDICGKLDDKTKNPVNYTAPPAVQNPAINVILTATSKADPKMSKQATIGIDSGIRVTVSPSTATVGTNESFRFTASLTNDNTPNDVTWLVTQASPISSSSASCSPGCGSIDDTGLYTAPATVPSTATATVVAVSKKDTIRLATSVVTIVIAAPATFTGIVPTAAPQGALFQDVYLLATNLRSTSVISFNGQALDPSQIKITTTTSSMTSGGTTSTSTTTSARIRLNANQLSMANATPGFSISIGGATGGPFFLRVVPVRPGLVSTGSDGVPQNSNSAFVTLDGGYFGTPGSPAASPSFGGGTSPGGRSFNVVNPRRMSVTLNPSDLLTPGLYSVSVQNVSGAPGAPAMNFAVQPDPATNGPSLVGTLSLASSPTDTPSPSAIALNRTLGVAIVANTGDNTVQRINVSGGAPVLLGGQIPIGSVPTGVAADELNHIAAVISKDTSSTPVVKRVTLLNLQTGATIGSPIDLSQVTPSATAPAGLPFSVGLEPNSGLGLVAFSSTNVGAIFNYGFQQTDPTKCLAGTTPPYCVVGIVTMNTGAHPQIVFHPRLHWGFTTPGGQGALTVVDVTRPNTAVAIVAAPNGLKRAGNIVTVTTANPHNLNPARALDPTGTGTVVNPSPEAVLITGAADSGFNGAFTVKTVIDAKTFTFAQTGADATSGGGQINYSPPLLTFSVGTTVQGISINPETQKALLTDPNFGQVFFLSMLDQTVVPLSISSGGAPEINATGAGFQPFANIAVSVNPVRNELSVYDPVKPQRLAVISTGGTGSGAVVVDPATNLALVANSGSNDISVIKLGSTLKTLHISGWVLQPGAAPGALLASQTAFTSATDLSITIFGSGFSGSPDVRLDGVSIGTGTVVSDRQISVTVPASFLAAPRRFGLDVALSGGTLLSNVTDFTVVQSVGLIGTGCTAPQPMGVAIDDQRDLAVVSNNGCNNVSVIDLAAGSTTFGKVTQTIAVGTAPTGVALSPRLGLAVVANSNTVNGTPQGTGTASVIDLTQNTVTQTVNVGSNPTGVAFNQDSGRALVVNTNSNTMTQIDLNVSPPTAATNAVDQEPISVAVDPDRQIAIVGAVNLNTNPASGVLDVVDLSGSVPVRVNTILAFQTLPSGVVFDPATTKFYAVASQSNAFVVADPDTSSAQPVRVGVNPTSLAYNFQTGTLITVNAGSNTISVVDAQTFQTKATFALGNAPTSLGSSNPQFVVAIHPRTNLAVIADLLNNRVLLYPVPQ